MSKADEMFKNLGYEKSQPYTNILNYENEKNIIEFYIDLKSFTCSNNINMLELQCIVEKCKELGWIHIEDIHEVICPLCVPEYVYCNENCKECKQNIEFEKNYKGE